MKHTKGPWSVINYRNTSDYTIRQDFKTYGINAKPIITSEGLEPENNLANAKLIAAAPEMLEALEDVKDVLDQCFTLIKTSGEAHRALEQINKVIKKAKGDL